MIHLMVIIEAGIDYSNFYLQYITHSDRLYKMKTRTLLFFFIFSDEPLPALAPAEHTYTSKQLNPVKDHVLSIVILSVRSYLTKVLSAGSPGHVTAPQLLCCGIITRNSVTMIESLVQES
jgi:hypothetical protein